MMPPAVPYDALTAIVPARNEARTLSELLGQLLEVVAEVRVVDDGSTDGTYNLAVDLVGADRVCRNQSGRHGKGAAVTYGLQFVTTPLVVIQDADLEYAPSDLPRLAARFAAPAGRRPLAVFGVRQPTAGTARLVSEWGVRGLNSWAAACGGVRSRDHATCYKMLPTRLLRLLDAQAAGFDWCGEVCVKLGRLAAEASVLCDWQPLEEVDISYTPRTADEGKKLRYRDGLTVAQTMWRSRDWSPGLSPDALARELDACRHELDQAFGRTGTSEPVVSEPSVSEPAVA